jgi:hypothetical protein
MANLVKIKKIHIYTAMTEDAAECWEALKLLQDNNLPITHLNWRDDTELHNVYESLSTWNYSDGTVESGVIKKEFNKMPIIHWECVYDDDFVGVNAAQGLTELQNSQLMANLDKVVRPVTE